MYNALLKILTGNGLASLISMLSVTIIARLYSTEDLGYFYLFVASSQVFTIVLCFRYEQALVLCKLKTSADRLVMYCIFQSTINTTLIITGICIIHQVFPSIAWIEVATSNFHLYFLSLLAVSFNQIYINLCLRENKIGIISCNLILNASLVAIFSITLGYFYSSSESAILSFVLGNVVSSIHLIFVSANKSHFKFSQRNFIFSFKKYRKFLIINTPNNFINNLGLLLPAFMLAQYAGAKEVALFSMAMKLINPPFNILIESIRKVYYKYSVDALVKKELFPLIRKASFTLLLAGALICSIIFLISDFIIVFLLGKEWIAAATYLNIILAFKFFQFVSSPLAPTLIVLNKQELGLYISVIFIIIRYLSMLLFSEDAIQMMTAYSLTGALFYLTYLLLCLFLVQKYEKNN